uniref:Putative secreted protein n=1 Tax=Anopheles marajoara TaxID=58244 RepID=A0A2M4CCZ4_9DIPT
MSAAAAAAATVAVAARSSGLARSVVSYLFIYLHNCVRYRAAISVRFPGPVKLFILAVVAAHRSGTSRAESVENY